nr:MAG TPA: hypothetical protein [Caudoviricetes sp.]
MFLRIFYMCFYFYFLSPKIHTKNRAVANIYLWGD